MTAVAIQGVGMTRFGNDRSETVVELASRAVERALADAACDTDDITSVHIGNTLGTESGTGIGLTNAMGAALNLEGVRVDRIENTSASGASAIHRGVEAIASGGSDSALVIGVERMSVGGTAAVTDSLSQLVHDREYEQGLTMPSFGGLAARTYVERYDVDREALAQVAVKNHRNGSYNPYAHFQSPVSIETVLDSPPVAEPLRLYDCCPISDGAAAVVLSESGPVSVTGLGGASSTHAIAERNDLLDIDSARRAAEIALRDAGIDRDDLDVLCLHDAFTILELLELETLGFYEPGASAPATTAGETAVDGSLPVNPGGGLKARGHPLGATGVSQLIELTWQLQNDADPERQVSGATAGLALNMAGFGNNSVCTILEST